MIQNDAWIIEKAKNEDMLSPFAEEQVRGGVVSFGVSSYGYDARIADEFRIINTEDKDKIIDPKNIDESIFTTVKADHCIIQPNSYILGKTVEYFKMPKKTMGICVGKSTYARSGIVTNITPLEPEWEGYVTMSIVNASPLPVKIYANEGIIQVIFFESDSAPLTSYKDKGGKYQAQKDLTLSKIDPVK